MRNRVQALIVISAIFIFNGCGGGGGDPVEPSTNSGEQTTTSLPTINLSGKAVDSHALADSTVCLDLNGDNTCQENTEPTSKTDVEGKYTLTITEAHQKNAGYSTAKIVLSGGQDVTTGVEFIGTLSTLFDSSIRDNILLTPLSTLVALLKERNQLDREEAERQVASSFNLEVSQLSKDPLEELKIGKKAIFEANLKIQQSAQLIESQDNLKKMEDIYNAFTENIANQKEFTDGLGSEEKIQILQDFIDEELAKLKEDALAQLDNDMRDLIAVTNSVDSLELGLSTETNTTDFNTTQYVVSASDLGDEYSDGVYITYTATISSQYHGIWHEDKTGDVKVIYVYSDQVVVFNANPATSYCAFEEVLSPNEFNNRIDIEGDNYLSAIESGYQSTIEDGCGSYLSNETGTSTAPTSTDTPTQVENNFLNETLETVLADGLYSVKFSSYSSDSSYVYFKREIFKDGLYTEGEYYESTGTFVDYDYTSSNSLSSDSTNTNIIYRNMILDNGTWIDYEYDTTAEEGTISANSDGDIVITSKYGTSTYTGYVKDISNQPISDYIASDFIGQSFDWSNSFLNMFQVFSTGAKSIETSMKSYVSNSIKEYRLYQNATYNEDRVYESFEDFIAKSNSFANSSQQYRYMYKEATTDVGVYSPAEYKEGTLVFTGSNQIALQDYNYTTDTPIVLSEGNYSIETIDGISTLRLVFADRVVEATEKVYALYNSRVSVETLNISSNTIEIGYLSSAEIVSYTNTFEEFQAEYNSSNSTSSSLRIRVQLDGFDEYGYYRFQNGNLVEDDGGNGMILLGESAIVDGYETKLFKINGAVQVAYFIKYNRIYEAFMYSNNSLNLDNDTTITYNLDSNYTSIDDFIAKNIKTSESYQSSNIYISDYTTLYGFFGANNKIDFYDYSGVLDPNYSGSYEVKDVDGVEILVINQPNSDGKQYTPIYSMVDGLLMHGEYYDSDMDPDLNPRIDRGNDGSRLYNEIAGFDIYDNIDKSTITGGSPTLKIVGANPTATLKPTKIDQRARRIELDRLKARKAMEKAKYLEDNK